MTQCLNGIWNLKCIENGKNMPADVPGTVYGALLANGEMPDPYRGDNENGAMELMKQDYEFSRHFDTDGEIWTCKGKMLVFEGVDTLADIYLNGEWIASVNNMHRTWKIRVDNCLRKNDNELLLHFHAPIPFIREAYEKCPTDGSSDAMKGFPLIRKSHCMFGWDWGPHLPDIGIFRSVTLQGIGNAGLERVDVKQEHNNGKVKLRLHAQARIDDGVTAEYVTCLTTPDGKVLTWNELPETIDVPDPELWWPNGFGKQPLYTLRVEQYANGIRTGLFTRRIGLRTMEIHREKDRWGESFSHRVNGVDIFAMGADYIPEDSLLGRLNPERTRLLLQQCRDCNFNTIRVWGGGFYPSDWFYDICDELGLLVWQDLMFACAVYELDDAFEENIIQEVKDNLIRLRDHASLALICGNNEMELFVKDRLWVTKPSQVTDYVKMYEYIFPKLMKEFAPDVPYWPASPSSGGHFDDPNDANRGDVHYWAVWHGNEPFSAYREHFFRYLSEFGFQSLPAMKTVRSFTEKEEDLNLFSYCMEKHQRNGSANAKIMQYMGRTFLYPNGFDTLIYASQLLQGEAVRYGVEHFRRNRGRCMGAIYWQLNDCWPVISWASIDYFGRWKALQYYAKRFFAPVLLSCEETSMMTENININGENETFVPAVRFNVSNETTSRQDVTVLWELRKADGSVLKTHEEHLTVEPLSAKWLEKETLPEADPVNEYVSFRLLINGSIISHGSILFTMPKYFHFADPKLRVKAEGDVITVEADSYARSVEILNENEDLILEDNYFDMDPGTKTVKVLKGNTDHLRVRSVYDIR